MSDSQTRLGTALVVLALACYAVIDVRLALAWTSDLRLWTRVLEVSPRHARAMNNIGHALDRTSPDKSQALFFFASARERAKVHPWMPQRERNTMLAVADQNLVAILVGWTHEAVDLWFVAKPYRPEDYVKVADVPSARADLITELLEELWQLQQSGAFVAR